MPLSAEGGQCYSFFEQRTALRLGGANNSGILSYESDLSSSQTELPRDESYYTLYPLFIKRGLHGFKSLYRTDVLFVETPLKVLELYL